MQDCKLTSGYNAFGRYVPKRCYIYNVKKTMLETRLFVEDTIQGFI